MKYKEKNNLISNEMLISNIIKYYNLIIAEYDYELIFEYHDTKPFTSNLKYTLINKITGQEIPGVIINREKKYEDTLGSLFDDYLFYLPEHDIKIYINYSPYVKNAKYSDNLFIMSLVFND